MARKKSKGNRIGRRRKKNGQFAGKPRRKKK
jgi:hypothetical protein